ncbi:DUF6520 family protein [Flavobacterium hydatis]|jgi:hypothetical protein|uniref:Uncharacterized protein n=1 Tax=Flavobacterium hydatis TaxID=991 RepID=A0A086AM57_FLAHY|nr:DUF6520 family protein [Flavobacterium hydatis]KFF17771.1 hypothetical protein IW20_07325 [Flavobacterium hydatis]OXA93693.1 hypothetical protein B0A62_13175 [Flavobacterium hydatis]
MKAIILKKMMPAAVFVLAISGAFLTTSMQSDAKITDDPDPITGFVAIPEDPCGMEVDCVDEGDELCRLFYDNGPQAYGLNEGETSCPITLFRPD